MRAWVYHERDNDVYDRNGHANEYGEPPFLGDRVDQSEYQ